MSVEIKDLSTEKTTLESTDWFEIQEAAGGAGSSKKVRAANLHSAGLTAIPERSTAPTPASGTFEIWMSDGTPTGTSAGDIVVTINSGGTTKSVIWADFSAIP